MQQLSSLDATFLFIETPEMPMHAGALQLYELPAGTRGGFLAAVRRHVKERLAILPMLRRRLWWMPLNMANPAWVDAEPDLRRHIVAAPLSRGASMGELEAAVARLHAERLDRELPLWKFHVFEDLAAEPGGRRRVALYMQLHHAAFDARTTVELANALMDLSPEPRRLSAKRARQRKVYELGMSEMLGGVLAGQATRVAGMIREMPATLGSLRKVAGQAVSYAGLVGAARASAALAPATPFNVTLGVERSFATLTLPRETVQELAQAHGATLEDMLLTLCGSALRRYLVKRRRLPRKSLIAAVPVDAPVAGEATDAQAKPRGSVRLVSLGTNVADLLRRLAHVRQSRAPGKAAPGDGKPSLPADFPSLGVPWLLEAASALYGRARIAERIPQFANVLVGIVPGPSMPLYLAGARLLADHPASFLVHGLALNVTVQVRAQSLDFGLVADAKALPELRELADAIRIAWDDMLALPRPGERDPAMPGETLVGRAQRAVTDVTGAMTGVVGGALTGALGRMTQRVVGSAIDGAVSQVTARLGKPAPRKSTKRR
ncbi:MAG TPA: wax ester/triacylglycerol synthase family O-acyltransferase [Rubrivivax sp.]|nr:wax ester/triacylglycerol synthase family O-acyltransferase [Burkholderiales bacterium]HNU12181.1 wax ester/triacylglycerol synthase family O-acyltransferase [Rubrivivax sp.]